ncbi:hypothetical protein JOD82_002027 [Paenibacillus sp. 1182]|uniref:hypothetical protein n=1 Tax=Paenibacillus sp. 1182 TaxID=2806565 RepID=UPI001AE0F352|nr:hypothetical protein [Paenibacillus sp. 1182]MBP1309007.1 hypothetical protein [Paenibacillus sp. 1182]
MLAHTVLGVKMNKQLEQLIKDRVSVTNMPYEFKIMESLVMEEIKPNQRSLLLKN